MPESASVIPPFRRWRLDAREYKTSRARKTKNSCLKDKIMFPSGAKAGHVDLKPIISLLTLLLSCVGKPLHMWLLGLGLIGVF